jgi:hypothetical protein
MYVGVQKYRLSNYISPLKTRMYARRVYVFKLKDADKLCARVLHTKILKKMPIPTCVREYLI